MKGVAEFASTRVDSALKSARQLELLGQVLSRLQARERF
jgi:hypothetical protein